MHRLITVVGAAALLSLPTFAAPQTRLAAIQPDPMHPTCKERAPHELCVLWPRDGVARAELLSEPFYAVLLRSAARCAVTEAERLEAQRAFPSTKVFATRFECGDNVEENLTYTTDDARHGFLALYASRSLREARQRLREVQASGRYTGTNIRRMQARLVAP